MFELNGGTGVSPVQALMEAGHYSFSQEK